MKNKKHKSSTNFALVVGWIYFFLILFVCVNFYFADISDTQYVGFFASTIYPYLALIAFGFGYCFLPIAIIIYIILFFYERFDAKKKKIDKIVNSNIELNNEEENISDEKTRTDSSSNIFFKVFLYFASCIALVFILSVSIHSKVDNTTQIFLKPNIKSVLQDKTCFIFEFEELPKFVDEANFSQEPNIPIFIKLKVNKNKSVQVIGQTREQPQKGVYLKSKTNPCSSNDSLCNEIDYSTLKRYCVSPMDFEQTQNDINNGALIKVSISKNGLVRNKKIVRK